MAQKNHGRVSPPMIRVAMIGGIASVESQLFSVTDTPLEAMPLTMT